MRATDGGLLILAMMVAWSFYRAHRNPQFTFNVFDLIMENGRVSRIACAFMATLLVTSWVIVRLTVEGKLTEGLFTAYVAAWVMPIIAKMFGQPMPVPSTTVTTISTDTKKTVKTK